MIEKDKIKLFLVDDDALFLRLMEIELLQYPDFIIETFASGELCMESIAQQPDIIILDYHLDGSNKNAMNGIDTLHKIKDFNPNIQVVMLSAQDNVDVAIDSVQNRAIDYVVKSDTAFLRIQNIIKTIQNFKKMEKGLDWFIRRV